MAEMTEASGMQCAREGRVGRSSQAEEGVTQRGRNLRSTILRLRGLPFRVSTAGIVDWFHEGLEFANPLTPDCVHIVADYGRPSGTAFVEFTTHEDAEIAMGKDRQMMGTRYIEIFESSVEERARYTSH